MGSGRGRRGQPGRPPRGCRPRNRYVTGITRPALHRTSRSRRSVHRADVRRDANRGRRSRDNGGVQQARAVDHPGHAGLVPVQGRAGPGALRRQGEEPAQPGHVVLRRRPDASAPARWWPTADTVEWIGVRNEVEALFLEFNLIQKHRPRFNIRYKDDKSYPYLAVTLDEEWPRAMVLRGAKRKGVRYFGPYAHAYAIRETLDLLLRTFPIRTCTKGKFDRYQRLGRPCLYAHIEKCAAPCVGAVSHEEYDGLVNELLQFLDGDTAADPRPARQADARGERRARVRARGAPPRPDRLGHARRSSASRWSTPRRRTTTPSASSTTSSRRRCRCSSCARAASSAARRWWSTRSRTSTTPELVGRLLEQLYGGADRRRHPARGARPRAARRRPALRGVPHRGAPARRSRVRVPQRGAKRELLADRHAERRRGVRSATSCGAPPTTTPGRARSSRCRRRSACPRRRCASSASTSRTSRAPRSSRRWW